MMPTTKHKRKASTHSRSKTVKSSQPPGLIASHPKAFVFVGLFFVALGLYLLAFESQYNTMFGLAMLSLITGVVTTIYANFSVSKKKAD